MRTLLLFSIIMSLITVASCKKDEDPEPEPEPEFCDNVNSAFQAEVLPIFQATCGVSGCHDEVAAEENNIFVDYETIKASIESDQQQFLESINFVGGSTDWMPRDDADENATEEDQLPQSQIDKIECWIERGMQND